MKIIFIGVHNKPGKAPLCSSTVSGKTIDAVIAKLNGITCQKVNLFDVDYMPKPDEAKDLLHEFTLRVYTTPDDVWVLLGGVVQKYLSNHYLCNMVKAAHPSLQYAKISRQYYIDQLADKIKLTIWQSKNFRIVYHNQGVLYQRRDNTTLYYTADELEEEYNSHKNAIL